MDKPIPALYCCYLLRSMPCPRSLYIGSTPNPKRRLAQHNGTVKGGASKTSLPKNRPWAMVCLVTGFPSKIAALQFEWAWQHPNITRHIPPEQRISPVVMRSRKGVEVASLKPPNPYSLAARMANLHLLLRSSSFERWPLGLKFYDDGVFKVWNAQAKKAASPLPKRVEATLESAASTGTVLHGIENVDPTYRPMKAELQLSETLFSMTFNRECGVCDKRVRPRRELVLRCSNAECGTVWHMDCLSQTFLARAAEHDALLPTHGSCSECGQTLRWIDLVKDLSLRIRGQRVLEALFNDGSEMRTSKKNAADPEAADAAEESLLGGSLDDVYEDVNIDTDEHDSFDDEAPKTSNNHKTSSTAQKSASVTRVDAHDSGDQENASPESSWLNINDIPSPESSWLDINEIPFAPKPIGINFPKSKVCERMVAPAKQGSSWYNALVID